jgi:hypothetical protein
MREFGQDPALRGAYRLRSHVQFSIERCHADTWCPEPRGSTLLVRVEDVVLRFHGHMAHVSAV